MKKMILPAFVLLFALLGCNLSSTPAATPGPTLPPTPAPSIRVALRAPDGSIQIVASGVSFDPSAPAFDSGLLPAGGYAGGTEFALDFTSGSQAQAMDASGTRSLSFVANPNYGLAVLPGSSPRLAWGTQLDPGGTTTTLDSAAPDGSGATLLRSETVDANLPYELVAERWSADGGSLYYSKEPYGIGGYIPFPGASSLYRLDIASGNVTELIPFNMQAGPSLCYEALSADQRFLADHCTAQIRIHDLTSGSSTTIDLPAGASGYGTVGDPRFSPDNSRVAYALAKGDPSAEQGLVALSDGLSGASHVILTGQPGEAEHVLAWLNASTLLLQSDSMSCSTTCPSSLWTIGVDGSNLKKLSDGTYLNLVLP